MCLNTITRHKTILMVFINCREHNNAHVNTESAGNDKVGG